MHVYRFDPEKFHAAYGIHCQGFELAEGELAPPVATTWCVVKPGEVARAHQHQEHEAFIVTRGHGRMRVDDEVCELAAGDAVLMAPFSHHELTNLSPTEDLVFLDLCWEDLGKAPAFNDAALAQGAAPRPRRVLVTATPPTPNGDLHVGHLSGPYLSADLHRRYLAMRGVAVGSITGIDDHQTYVVKKALATGKTAREVASSFGDSMIATWRGMGMEADHVAKPLESKYHVQMVQACFHDLWAKGAIVAREAETLHCPTCAMDLFEAAVHGICPHCGKGCDGNACEDCGRPNDCVDLNEPRCGRCGSTPTTRLVRRLYFPLAPWEAKLREYHASCAMNPHLRSLCDAMVADGLPEIAVSQVGDWGIPVGLPGFEDQRIYVWFEMGPGYLAATREWLERTGQGSDWREIWQADDAEVVQFFGFDNGYYHAVLFPAIFFAWDAAIRPPAAFVTNEFYFYEGSKFSTSRNHAFWGQQLIAQVQTDEARFYVAYDCPERANNNFTLAALRATVDRELLQGWQGWLAELAGRVAEEFDGKVPGTGAWTSEQQQFYQRLLGLVREAATAYEAATFSPQQATRAALELVRSAQRFGAAERHWRGVRGRFEERRTAVALEMLAVKALAQMVAPIMPGFAAALVARLGFGEGHALRWEEVPEFVPSGQALRGLGEPFFAGAAWKAT